MYHIGSLKRNNPLDHRVLNNLTLSLPYAFRTLGLDPPSPIKWLYIEPLECIERGEFGEQGNYSSLLPHLFMLESASLCPFGSHSDALPNISISF